MSSYPQWYDSNQCWSLSLTNQVSTRTPAKLSDNCLLVESNNERGICISSIIARATGEKPTQVIQLFVQKPDTESFYHFLSIDTWALSSSDFAIGINVTVATTDMTNSLPTTNFPRYGSTTKGRGLWLAPRAKIYATFDRETVSPVIITAHGGGVLATPT